MKEERIINALGQVEEKFIAEAAPGKQSRGKQSLWKLAALAACLLLAVTAGVLLIPGLSENRIRPTAEVPTEQSTSSPRQPDDTLTALFRQYGLQAEVIEAPESIGSTEIPYIRREDAVHTLKTSTVLDCTVEKIRYIRIPEPGSKRVWYISIMTLSLNSVIRGKTEEKRFTAVNAAALTSDTAVDFFTSPLLEDCREQLRAAFILKEVGENEIWTIGDTKIRVRELGDYSAVICMDYDGESLNYWNYKIPLSELDE